MPKKRFSAEQIVVVLRQIEVLLSQGKSPPVACREAGISQQSYYRWHLIRDRDGAYRRGLHPTTAIHWHSRSTDVAALSMAKRLC